MGCFLAGCLRKNYEKTQRKGITSVVRSARGACGSGGFFLKAYVPPLHAVAKFGTNYFLLKIKNLAER